MSDMTVNGFAGGFASSRGILRGSPGVEPETALFHEAHAGAAAQPPVPIVAHVEDKNAFMQAMVRFTTQAIGQLDPQKPEYAPIVQKLSEYPTVQVHQVLPFEKNALTLAEILIPIGTDDLKTLFSRLPQKNPSREIDVIMIAFLLDDIRIHSLDQFLRYDPKTVDVDERAHNQNVKCWFQMVEENKDIEDIDIGDDFIDKATHLFELGYAELIVEEIEKKIVDPYKQSLILKALIDDIVFHKDDPDVSALVNVIPNGEIRRQIKENLEME